MERIPHRNIECIAPTKELLESLPIFSFFCEKLDQLRFSKTVKPSGGKIKVAVGKSCRNIQEEDSENKDDEEEEVAMRSKKNATSRSPTLEIPPTP